MPSFAEFFGSDLERRIGATHQLRYAGVIDVEAHSGVTLAEFDSEREANISESDHADTNAIGVKFHEDPYSKWQLPLPPRIQSQ